jgi:hypothetical protein
MAEKSLSQKTKSESSSVVGNLSKKGKKDEALKTGMNGGWVVEAYGEGCPKG